MNIPFIDLQAQLTPLEPEILETMTRVLKSSAFILGPDVKEFENEFAAWSDCSHAVGVSSGLDALKLSLRVLGVGPGDEVITVANTFIATTLAISSLGATPVLVDVQKDSYNLDPACLESAITPKTKVIIPVHLYGCPADMDSICKIAEKHGLFVLEDASQAHGATLNNRKVGSYGHLAAFSLYPGKNLGAYGDAGIITTQNEQWAEELRTLRNYGSHQKYHHELLGENSRLDTLQAAILRIKLRHMDKWNTQRRSHASQYQQELADVGDLVLPSVPQDSEHVYHLFVIRTHRRDDLMHYLQKQGIGCIIHYPIPLHLQTAYAGYGWSKGDFPLTEQYADQILSLPIYPELSHEQISYICKSIQCFFKDSV